MFDKAFEKLQNMKGCLALELTDNTGEPLFFFVNKKDIKIKDISKEANSVFQGLHELSNKNSLGSIDTIQVTSNEYTLFSACSGDKERIHVHLFIVFDIDTNIALAKLSIDEAIKDALEIVNA